MAEARTLVDGGREARRAIEAGVVVDAAFVCPGLVRGEDAEAAVRMLSGGTTPVYEVSERVHDRLAFGNRGDGLVLVIQTPSTDLDALHVGPDPLLLVTEDVEKPGNLGAILRTADGAGCDAVIAIGGTDVFNPNVVRASVGTVFTVPIATTTAAVALAWLRGHGLRIVTARVDAPTPYASADLTGSVALLLGSESDGLSATWHDSRMEGVVIPMSGIADSLNVAATAAVLAFEARRQRDARR
ncbi:MAG: RNA methyltransferase [Chloroflexi bacterium]|nr:RNA methyltransferase [Chloroflexota bacterium]